VSDFQRYYQLFPASEQTIKGNKNKKLKRFCLTHSNYLTWVPACSGPRRVESRIECVHALDQEPSQPAPTETPEAAAAGEETKQPDAPEIGTPQRHKWSTGLVPRQLMMCMPADETECGSWGEADLLSGAAPAPSLTELSVLTTDIWTVVGQNGKPTIRAPMDDDGHDHCDKRDMPGVALDVVVDHRPGESDIDAALRHAVDNVMVDLPVSAKPVSMSNQEMAQLKWKARSNERSASVPPGYPQDDRPAGGDRAKPPAEEPTANKTATDVSNLVGMTWCTDGGARAALTACNNNADNAFAWLITPKGGGYNNTNCAEDVQQQLQMQHQQQRQQHGGIASPISPPQRQSPIVLNEFAPYRV
jgi:hypothetical protein